jgi:dihydrofolate reductase
MSTSLIAIVAASPTGVIGLNGDMPWRLSADLKRFKTLTMGAPIVMGRKTFDSIGRALPGRRNMVLSASNPRVPAGVEVFSSIDVLLAAISDVPRVFVIGGATLYEALLPRCEEIMVTRVFTQTAGDTSLRVDLEGYRQTYSERVPQSDGNTVPTEFQIWRRHSA